jgi:hypothetical protein
MEKSREIKAIMRCDICNYKCSTNSEFKRHLFTAKHKRLTTTNEKSRKIKESYSCDCGKTYIHNSSLYKHKKTCSIISNSIVIVENTDEKPSVMDIITQNKEIMDMLVLQNKELMNTIKEQSDTIRELIPKIGNNNTITTTTNNQFNLQTFLNEDCKDALNFSDFIQQIQITFEHLENQAENGYIKGISKLFIESLQELGQNKRPIHCSDKKRKTLYLKENDEWDKEGSLETLKKGINELTRRTLQTLMKEKENNAEEYKDADSDFSKKCIDIQRNLFPNAPRETTIDKVIEKITQSSSIV